MQRDYVTIVAGLPRTGTSMMMRILEAGGVPALTDGLRQSDPDNPRGYYEFELVKKTRDDPSWVPRARGMVVKMVYRLLRDLPADGEYRVVFMNRRLSEVRASQEAMLARSGKQVAAMDLPTFERTFGGELSRIKKWLAERENFRLLELDYNRIVEDPRPTVQALDDFLDGGLDAPAMLGAIEPSLYRQRS